MVAGPADAGGHSRADRTRPDYWPAADGPMDHAVRDGRAVRDGGAAVYSGLPANFYFVLFCATDAPVSFGRPGLLTFVCVLLRDRHANEFLSPRRQWREYRTTRLPRTPRREAAADTACRANESVPNNSHSGRIRSGSQTNRRSRDVGQRRIRAARRRSRPS